MTSKQRYLSRGGDPNKWNRSRVRAIKNKCQIARDGLLVLVGEEGLTYTLAPIPIANPFKELLCPMPK